MVLKSSEEFHRCMGFTQFVSMSLYRLYPKYPELITPHHYIKASMYNVCFISIALGTTLSKHFVLISFLFLNENTVDSRYLEVQGTHWTTSRYQYLDISDLQN